jgi:Ca-activated chloride channel family protein
MERRFDLLDESGLLQRAEQAGAKVLRIRKLNDESMRRVNESRSVDSWFSESQGGNPLRLGIFHAQNPVIPGGRSSRHSPWHHTRHRRFPMHPVVRTLLVSALLAIPSRALVIQAISVTDLKGPTCLVVDSVGGSQIPLAPFFTQVNVVVSDGLAQATMIQSFANPLGHRTEIAYVFPLPENGAVHAMSYQLHDSLYRAVVKEKSIAQAIYDSVRAAGGQAAILLQEKPNIFQQKLASLGAGDTVHVEIQVSIPLKYMDGSWELAFPTMVGERYQSAGTSGVAGTISGWNPPENRDGPGFQFNVLVKGTSFDSITSPTHSVQVEDVSSNRQNLALRGLVDSIGNLDTSYGVAVVLTSELTYPNRDFVLRLHRRFTGIDAVVASWKPQGHDTGYFHLNILPDLSLAAGARPPLDVVLMVDRSGSQAGWPMDREKQIAADILRRLNPTDRFTVLAFDDVMEYALGSSPVPATAANVDSAQKFVATIDARGGTLLLSAVNAAINTPISGDMQRVMVILTDGFITDEAAILDTIARKNPQPQVFTFGCGDNLNRYFLESAAAVGGGFATELTSTELAIPMLDSAWSRIETPQVNGLSVDFGGMQARDVVLPTSTRLYKGLPLVADGKYLVGGAQTITLRGERSGTPWTLARQVDLAQGSGMEWAVPKTWARAVIGKLDAAEGTTDSNKDSIVNLSVAYQVLSKYTAFLAVGGVPVEPDQSLANAYASSQVLEIRQLGARAGSQRFQVILQGGRVQIRWTPSERVDRIRILDLNGAVVRTLNPSSGASEAWWDGRSDRGGVAVSGTYLVEVRTTVRVLRSQVAWMP